MCRASQSVYNTSLNRSTNRSSLVLEAIARVQVTTKLEHTHSPAHDRAAGQRIFRVLKGPQNFRGPSPRGRVPF